MAAVLCVSQVRR